MNAIGSCAHGHDPRQCPVCAPELVERFKVIGEAFAIVRELARCTHATALQAGPYQICRACGARRSLPAPGGSLGAWRPADLVLRAAALAARADLSNPFKAS